MTNPQLPTPPKALNDPKVSTPDPSAQAQNVNPSVRPLSITEQIEKGMRRRISMSLPSRKLEVPEMPGYWLYWFVEENVPRALEAGFEFVDSAELPMGQFSPGTSKDINGNMDMGTRVRQIAGKSESGGPLFHVLMKLREEWAREDRRLRDNRNAQIMSTIFRGEHIPGEEADKAEDRAQRYVKTAQIQVSEKAPSRDAPLFLRPVRKRV